MSRPAGLKAFLLIWLGQLLSLLATDMSRFALSIWAYQSTGSATALGLVHVFHIVPLLLMSPFAGALVDRGNRKLMMALSDIGAGGATILVWVLHGAGALDVWHLYVASFITGIFASFQWPAYSASISLMVPKAQLGRANGLMSLQESVPHVFAPLLAGLLLPLVGLNGLLSFDVMTFVLAVLALALVLVPQPAVHADAKLRTSLLADAGEGFRYIFARPSLLGLQLLFLGSNLLSGLWWPMITPMILARTAGDSWTLGVVNSAGAMGGVLGGVLLGVWGGLHKRAHSVLISHFLSGAFGALLLGLGQVWWVWLLSSLLSGLVVPFMNGSNQAIWQSKVAPGIQGRVFAARRMIAWIPQPVMPVVAGLLADGWLEPAMRAPGPLPDAFGWLVGVGPGAGLGLLAAVAGVLTMIMSASFWLVRAVREADVMLPDHILTSYKQP